MIPIGDLTERVTFQSKSVTSRNDIGEEITAWTTGETVWAKVVPTTGNPRFAANQLHDGTDVVFQIRYLSTVTPLRRLLWNGVQHEILSVYQMDGRRYDMEIQARAGIKHG